ncbi:hypothetical protein I551_6968 [Mycobacterium ulcerans str. Harvey]|uniref:Uncharacterized protein n=1 Tax=Mycobacterium ulcerans str. Harvey TaxID=1299332 RepID=A0ABN0QQ12_MYCUL|nr:hypothetical protein I551_6968 [Mycobacterium ulcerans str. Harvey]
MHHQNDRNLCPKRDLIDLKPGHRNACSIDRTVFVQIGATCNEQCGYVQHHDILKASDAPIRTFGFSGAPHRRSLRSSNARRA